MEELSYKIQENGVVRDMTSEELRQMFNMIDYMEFEAEN